MSRGFRVWDIEAECYLSVSQHGEDGVLGITADGKNVLYLEDGEVSRFENGRSVIIEQDTGLKDKNGKKIYEGDIVKMACRVAKDESTLYKVVWDDLLIGYDLINLERSKADVGYLNKYNIKEHFKVIGNIHENKELLNG